MGDVDVDDHLGPPTKVEDIRGGREVGRSVMCRGHG
jgi:hypothetical protein